MCVSPFSRISLGFLLSLPLRCLTMLLFSLYRFLSSNGSQAFGGNWSLISITLHVVVALANSAPTCAWTCIQMCPSLCLFLYSPVCSSRCSWTSLNFPFPLWGPAAPQVMAVCALHINKPVSLKDTVYSSTQRPATVRIQRRLYQCNANCGKDTELGVESILIGKRGPGVVVELFLGPAGPAQQGISRGVKALHPTTLHQTSMA